MKNIKEWFRKHNRILKDILESIIVMLLGGLLFCQGYCFGVRDGESSTAFAYENISSPTNYHYPLKVSATVDTDILLLNTTPNIIKQSSVVEQYNGLAIGLLNNYNNSYFNGLLYPIEITFNGTNGNNTPINKIQLEAKYFQYISYSVLSADSPDYFQNSYALYFNDTMRNSILRVYCSYEYNINGNERVNFVENQTLSPYALTTALRDYPSRYSKNAFTLFPTQLFGSPSFEGVHLINPFREWDEMEGLSIFSANIYNFSLTIEFNSFVTSDYIYENWHRLAYCSFLYDYSAELPTVTVTNVSWFETVANSVDSFLRIEILPDLSFYDILILAVAIPILLLIVVFWLGG